MRKRCLAQEIAQGGAGTAGWVRTTDLLIHSFRLPDSKTGKKAIVLNAPGMTVLAVLPNVGAYVVAGQNAGTEKEKPRADLNKPWRSVAKRAGLAGVRIHDLRHTHATLTLQAGVHPKVVSERLGHANIGITLDIYSHVMPGIKEAAAERFDQIFADDVIKESKNSVSKK